MKARCFLILLAAAAGLLAAAPGARAATPAERLQEARAAYDRGDYAAAAEGFRDLIDQGAGSAALYYNLGNAEYKAGRLGRAVAYYRAALRRTPRDEDIRHNLDFLRRQVPRPETESRPLAALAGRFFTAFTWESLALAALAVFWLGAAGAVVLVLARGRPGWLRWAAAGTGVLFVVLAGWASARIAWDRNQNWGTVVAQRAQARTGPGEEFQVGFVIPEGREVRVLGREQDWLAVGLPEEGYKGWVRETEVWPDP